MVAFKIEHYLFREKTATSYSVEESVTRSPCILKGTKGHMLYDTIYEQYVV